MMTRRERMMKGFDREIQDHIERETQENMQRGMSPEEARHAAMRKFGNVTRVVEDTRAVWSFAWFEELLQDVRYGLRMLRKSPGFTAVAVLTLALGIGANTAIFSLIDAVMLRSLPVKKPSQLMVLKWSARKAPRVHGYMSSGDCPSDLRFGEANPSGCSFSEPMFREIAKAGQFSGVAAFANSGPVSLTGHGPATMVSGQLVSGSFFPTMGVRAAAGRVFDDSDDSATATPVAVLNYGYWQSAFGGAADTIGRTIELNGTAFTIIGVAEQKFTGITPGSDYDVWMPLSAGPRIMEARMWNDRQQNVSYWWLTVIGRMKPGVPVLQAQTAISGIFSNEMLHGEVPLFDAEGQMRGPGGGGPAGGGAMRSRIVLAGPPGGSEPMRAPAGGANGAVSTRTAAPPAGERAMVRVPAGATPKGAPNPEGAEGKQRTLLQAGDEPRISLVNAQTGLTGQRGRFANPLYVLMFAVGIILLIACSNVAGLMLARAATRQKEMALRLALGAARTRILRQLLTESVMLSSIGGILGIVFASWGAHAILSFVSTNQSRPLMFAAGLDMRVLGFTIAVSLLTGILFGLAPAFRGVQVDLTPNLKEGYGVAGKKGGGRRRFTIGNALVVTQVALAIVVLVGAGLMVRTLQNLRSVDVGFDAHNLVIFGINPTLAGYKDAQIDSFYRDLQGRLAETPGVKSASYSMVPLLSNSLMVTSFRMPGTTDNREVRSDMLRVGADFFSTMQIPFLAGRSFEPPDFTIAAQTPPAKVPTPVVVNQAFVQKYLGKENPLGKRFGEFAGDENEPPSAGFEIVGVVRDTKYSDLRREINPMMYSPQSGMGAAFEVRTAGDPKALVPVIRKTVAEISPNLPLQNVTTESQQIDRLLFQERLVARLAGFFSALALVLACIGLYGLLAYEVARRTREIGTRMALGAQERDVLRMVVRQGLALAVVGAAVGVGVALGVTRYLKTMLYGVKANDPVTIAAVGVLLLLVALAACWIPARRATRVDPMVALRYE